jgi:PAS domain S-box-containing protein
VYAVDKDWNVIFVNERVANLVGYTPQEMIGRNGWQL